MYIKSCQVKLRGQQKFAQKKVPPFAGQDGGDMIVVASHSPSLHLDSLSKTRVHPLEGGVRFLRLCEKAYFQADPFPFSFSNGCYSGENQPKNAQYLPPKNRAPRWIGQG